MNFSGRPDFSESPLSSDTITSLLMKFKISNKFTKLVTSSKNYLLDLQSLSQHVLLNVRHQQRNIHLTIAHKSSHVFKLFLTYLRNRSLYRVRQLIKVTSSEYNIIGLYLTYILGQVSYCFCKLWKFHTGLYVWLFFTFNLPLAL